MMTPPDINSSTKEQREKYIKETFACKNNCELCGLCKVFKGKSPELVYSDYINGNKNFCDIEK